MFNFSPEAQQVAFRESLCHDVYTDFQSGESFVVDDATIMDLQPWDYRILVTEPADAD